MKKGKRAWSECINKRYSNIWVIGRKTETKSANEFKKTKKFSRKYSRYPRGKEMKTGQSTQLKEQ